jgi:hypothetical protein
MNFIAYGQVSNEMFAYDKRTGQTVQQHTTQRGTQLIDEMQLMDGLQIFKSVMFVLHVVSEHQFLFSCSHIVRYTQFKFF